MAEAATRPIHFEGFVFDPTTGELHVEGETGVATRLPPKPARLLQLLLDRPGELVPREELADALWPGQHLDVDGSLAYTVRQVRLALGDDAAEPRFVETLPRRGYRFVGRVDGAGDGAGTGDGEGDGVNGDGPAIGGGGEPTGVPAAEPTGAGSAETVEGHGPAEGRQARTGPRRTAWLLFLAAAPLILLLLTHLGGTTPAPTRVGLLPLSPPERLADDPDARAANRRLEQALLVALADQEGLEVVGPATTAAAVAAGGTPREMGTALGVAFTVSGGYAPDEGVLFLQLIRSSDGGHLFARRFSGEEAALTGDLPSIAAELAQATERGE